MTTVYGKLNNLLTAANAKTGESDTTLTDAVQTLIDGYGGGGGLSVDDVADSAISGDIALTVSAVKQYAFYGNNGISSVYSDSVTSVDASAFNGCGTVHFDLPNLTTVASSAFRGCSGDMYLPGLTSITGNYPFGGNNGEWLVLPRLTGALGSDYLRTLYYSKLDLGSVSSFGTRSLYQGSIKTIVILRSTTVVTASNSDAIGSIASATTVYVPSSLVSDYQTATVWSAKGCTFAALEGSPYEQLDWFENQ